MYKRIMFMTLKILGALAAFSLLTMLLWNALMPELFGLRPISCMQAAGLLLLCRLLFGGFGFLRDAGHFAARRERRAILEHWHSMTAEERKRCMASVRSHSHRHGGTSAEQVRE